MLYAAGVTILILATLFLRSAGLGRDLPFAAHCDVPKQLGLIRVQLDHGGMSFIRTGYPIGHQQVAAFATRAVAWTAGWMGFSSTVEDQTLLVAARFNVLVFSLAGLLFTILAGRLLFGRRAALLAGLLAASDGFLLVHTHWAMGDVPQAAMVMGALYFCLRIQARGRFMDYVWAGACAGAAAAIKYYGGYMIAAVLLSHFLAQRRNWWGLLAAPLAAAAAFALLTPLAWQDPAAWLDYTLREFREQGQKATGGYLEGWAASWAQWTHYSPATALLTLPGAILVLMRRRRRDFILLSALAVAAFLIQGLRVVHLKEIDQVIQVQLFALASAGGLVLAWERLGGLRRVLLGRPAWAAGIRAGFAALCALLILWQCGQSARLSYLLYLPDTRKQLQAWLRDNTPPGRPDDYMLVDATIGDATKLEGAAHYYPEDMGYSMHPFSSRDPAEAQAFLAADQGRATYVITHQIQGQRPLTEFDRANPPVQVFELDPVSHYNPTVRVYQPGRPAQGPPWRETGVTPLPWPPLVQAGTPLSRSKVRQSFLTAGEHHFLIQSPEPLPVLAVTVQGSGKVTVIQGGQEEEIYALADRPRVLVFEPSGGFPWRPRTYRLGIEVDQGPVLAGLILDPAELAAAWHRAGDDAKARAQWEKCLRQGRSLLPQDSLVLARLREGAGDAKGAEALRAAVFARYPALRQVLAKAAGGRAGEVSTGELAAALGLESRDLSWRRRFLPAATAGETTGRPSGGCDCPPDGLVIPAGTRGWTKIWMGDYVAQRRLIVRFTLQALAPPPPGASCRVDVFGHFAYSPHGVLAEKQVTLTGQRQTVDLAVDAPMLPMGLEMRLMQSGGAEICLAGVEVLPEAGAVLEDLAGSPARAR